MNSKTDGQPQAVVADNSDNTRPSVSLSDRLIALSEFLAKEGMPNAAGLVDEAVWTLSTPDVTDEMVSAALSAFASFYETRFHSGRDMEHMRVALEAAARAVNAQEGV